MQHTTNHTIFFRSLLISLVLILMMACGGTPTPTPTATPPPLAKELIFYNWDGDDVESVRLAFEEEYGVKVIYASFDSQEEAVANIKAGEHYDVVVLEHSFFPELLAANLLTELDFRNIPNFKNVQANFRDLNHDPDNKHSVPFTWGSTFLLYREDLIDPPLTQWADIWELGSSGKIAFRDSPRETMGLALKALGYSVNSENLEELNAAFEHLMTLKDNVIFVGGSAEDAVPVLQNDGAVALMGWSEDAELGEEEGLALAYTFPQEGLLLWGDNFVIPANSPNKYTAELFLDFLLRPEINADIVNETYYATTNETAHPFIDAEILEDPLIFPPSDALKNAEVILPISPEASQLYEELWQQFKTIGE